MWRSSRGGGRKGESKGGREGGKGKEEANQVCE
jgi:hypothetical protein